MNRFWMIASIAVSGSLLNLAGCEKGVNVTEQPAPAPPANAAPQPQAGYAPPAAPAPTVVYEGVPVANPPPVAYTYYYYPDSEVYFEPATQIYFWFDGGGWHHDRVLPRTIVVQRNAPVTVQLNTDRPWTMHERVRVEHPGHAVIRHARNE